MNKEALWQLETGAQALSDHVPSFFLLPQVASLQMARGGGSDTQSEANSPVRAQTLGEGLGLGDEEDQEEGAAQYGLQQASFLIADGDAERDKDDVQALAAPAADGAPFHERQLVDKGDLDGEAVLSAGHVLADAEEQGAESQLLGGFHDLDANQAGGRVTGASMVSEQQYISVLEELEMSQQQVEELRLQYDAVQAELEAVSDQYNVMLEELEAGRAQLAEEAEARRSARVTEDEVTQRLSDRLLALEVELGEARERLTERSAREAEEVHRLMSEAAALEVRLEAQVMAAVESSAIEQGLRAELEEQRATEQGLRVELEEQRMVAAQLEDARMKEADRAATLESSEQNSRAELAALEGSLAAAMARAATLQTALGADREASSVAVALEAKRSRELLERVERLTRELLEAEARRASLEAEVADLTQRLRLQEEEQVGLAAATERVMVASPMAAEAGTSPEDAVPYHQAEAGTSPEDAVPYHQAEAGTSPEDAVPYHQATPPSVELKGLRETLRSSEVESEALRSELVDLRSSHEVLIGELAALRESHDALIGEQAALRERHDALQDQLAEEGRSRAAERERLASEQDSRMEELRAQREALQAQLEQLAVEKAEQQVEWAGLMRQVEMVEQVSRMRGLRGKGVPSYFLISSHACPFVVLPQYCLPFHTISSQVHTEQEQQLALAISSRDDLQASHASLERLVSELQADCVEMSERAEAAEAALARAQGELGDLASGTAEEARATEARCVCCPGDVDQCW